MDFKISKTGLFTENVDGFLPIIKFWALFAVIFVSEPLDCEQLILVFKHFFYKNYVGLSLWPFIILKEDSLMADEVLINHERIHLKQQRELLILPFYLWYISEWLLRTVLYLDSYRAYQNISFEREAYANEKDMEYLAKRRTFGFLKYLTRWLFGGFDG